MGLFVLAAIGCASTRMTSMAAPDAHLAGRHFKRIMVLVSLHDLATRKEAEDQFVKDVPAPKAVVDSSNHMHMKFAGYEFVPSYTILFPGSDYTSAQMDSALRADSIDAVLIVAQNQSGVVTTTGPSSYSTQCTPGLYSATCVTKESPGVTTSKPWASYEAHLYDAANGKVIWYATSTTGGSAFSSWNAVVHSMADKTVEKLKSDGIIQ